MQLNDKRYEKQLISVDAVIFSVIDTNLNVLLLKRNKEPYTGMYSLPGGGVYNTETCEEAIKRELWEKLKVNLDMPFLAGVFSDPKRDIRFRNISVTYYGITNPDNLTLNNDAKWFQISQLPNLAFDHKEIILKSLELLRANVYDISFMEKFLKETFTLPKLQKIYESILNVKLDKRNFRRKIESLDCLEKTGLKNELDSHKKSDIYRLKKK